MFVLIQNGAVIKPYDTVAQFLRDHPDVELADNTTLADLEEFGVLEVAEVPPPAVGEGQTLDLDTPMLVDAIPQQNWIVGLLKKSRRSDSLCRGSGRWHHAWLQRAGSA
ncbi:MAG: hypothetical protein R3E21_07945 [Caenibius sp.]